MDRGKISIIVPIYGIEDYLEECIISIINQTYENIEIILVDDGSKDGCPQICDRWAEMDHRIKVIHKGNGGLVDARKAGVSVATGEYIGYVDGDDWIEPDMYESMMQTMLAENVDVVITGFKKELYGKCIECLNSIAIGCYRDEQLEQEIFPRMLYDQEKKQLGLYTYVWNKLFKREKIIFHQMNVDNRIVIGEDVACLYPLLLDVHSIAVLDDVKYHYRQRMDSILRGTVKCSNKIGQLQVLYQYLKNCFDKSSYAHILQPQLECFYIEYLLMFSDFLVNEYPELGSNFPYEKIQKDNRIIIYSAGAYGMHVYKQFTTSSEYSIVAWADPDSDIYMEHGDGVVSLQTALGQEFDYIIIASSNYEFISKSLRLLKDYQVQKAKILTLVDVYEEAVKKMKDVGILFDVTKC